MRINSINLITTIELIYLIFNLRVKGEKKVDYDSHFSIENEIVYTGSYCILCILCILFFIHRNLCKVSLHFCPLKFAFESLKVAFLSVNLA